MKWLTSQHTYEDFPLFLRRVDLLYTSVEKERFPTLVTVTHTFTHRHPDGRPTADYNDTLLDFDCELVDRPPSCDAGVPVLVETFGGKRHYYFYMTSPDAITVFDELRERHPEHDLEIDPRPDPDWAFIRRYARDFFPDAVIP